MSQPTPQQPVGMPNRTDSGDESQERTFTIWAWSSPLEDISSGQGWVIPVSKAQMIKGLDSDLIAELGLQAFAEVGQSRNARRKSMARNQMASKSKQRAMDDQVKAMQKYLAMIDEKIVMIEPLVAKGLLSRSSLIRLAQQGADIEAMLEALENLIDTNTSNGIAIDQIETVTQGNSTGSEQLDRQSLLDSMFSPEQYIHELLATHGDSSSITFLRMVQPVILILSAEMLKAESAMNGANGQSIDGQMEPGFMKVMVGVTSQDSHFAGGTLIPMPGTGASIEIKTKEMLVPKNIVKSLLSIHDALREY